MEKFEKTNTITKGSKIQVSMKDLSAYPLVRHLTSYESAMSILNNGYIACRKELENGICDLDPEIVKLKKLNDGNSWWDDRKKIELKRFGTNNIVYCIADWFSDAKYETGHGPVMIYFKPTIFEDFKITMTIEDSLTENRETIFSAEEIKHIYYHILNTDVSNNEAKTILNNINNKNEKGYFITSKGKLFIDADRFHNKYAEIQIHASKIPIQYIQSFKFTDNYLDQKAEDLLLKEKLKLLLSKNKLDD